MTTTELPIPEELLPTPRYYLTIEKNLRRATEQYNRIKKLIPGRRRIWALADIADDLLLTASLESTEGDKKYHDQLVEWALMLQRLEFDLTELRDAARGEKRRMSRTDPRHWRGERP